MIRAEMQGERRIKHYRSSQKILLVGEGDFSFSASLANAFGSATNIVATSLDDRKTVIEKHPSAMKNLTRLLELGCSIEHEVDAQTMATHPLLCTRKFDRIVFNFPHAGFRPAMREHDITHIQRHQELVRGFFKSARDMLKVNGEIHVTHKTHYPFGMWQVEKLGQEEGLRLIEEVEFDKLDYPGYENKKGDGWNTNGTFPVRECSTFKFVRSTL